MIDDDDGEPVLFFAGEAGGSPGHMCNYRQNDTLWKTRGRLDNRPVRFDHSLLAWYKSTVTFRRRQDTQTVCILITKMLQTVEVPFFCFGTYHSHPLLVPDNQTVRKHKTVPSSLL